MPIKLILGTIIKANNQQKAVQLMAHVFAVQQIWLNRCKGEPATGIALWPDWHVDTLAQVIDDNHGKWINFLHQLDPGDFDKVIGYKTFKGDSFENKLADVLGHIINHGTHHRAQAGQLLNFAGVENLPVTDYIFYLWQ